MTINERVDNILALVGTWKFSGGQPVTLHELVDRIACHLQDVERMAIVSWASIALKGGDGKDRLETAITLGPNAAVAAAILEQRGSDELLREFGRHAWGEALKACSERAEKEIGPEGHTLEDGEQGLMQDGRNRAAKDIAEALRRLECPI